MGMFYHSDQTIAMISVVVLVCLVPGRLNDREEGLIFEAIIFLVFTVVNYESVVHINTCRVMPVILWILMHVLNPCFKLSL